MAKKPMKAAPKKPAKKQTKTNKTAMAQPVKNDNISVDIRKAQNGYVVSSHDKDWNPTTYIAKTKQEAKTHAQKLLKI